MSDRSFGDFIGSGLFWTGVIYFFPRLLKAILGGVFPFLFWFIGLAFVGYFVLVFTGSNKPQKGQVPYEDVQVSAVGTLDMLTLTVRNLNTDHEIKFLEMDCAGQSVMMRHIMPGSSKGYSTFAGNIARGGIQCELLRVHS